MVRCGYLLGWVGVRSWRLFVCFCVVGVVGVFGWGLVGWMDDVRAVLWFLDALFFVLGFFD